MKAGEPTGVTATQEALLARLKAFPVVGPTDYAVTGIDGVVVGLGLDSGKLAVLEQAGDLTVCPSGPKRVIVEMKEAT